MHGFVSTQWKVIQHKHYEWISSNKIGSTWTSLLIRKIRIVQYNMWLSRNLVVHPIDNKELETNNKCSDSEIQI